MDLMPKSLRKILDNSVRLRLQENKKKVKKIFIEAVKVRHKLWSDDEEEEFAKNDPYRNTGHKQMKVDDELDNYQYDVTN